MSAASDREPSPAITSRPSSGSLRGHPAPSPRSSRHPSMSQQSVADLIASPPLKGDALPHRDWRHVRVSELLESTELRFVQLDTPVEVACQMLIDYDLSSLPIRQPGSDVVCGTFDYSDLNAFLLLIMGIYQPEEGDNLSSFADLARKAREGSSIPVQQVKDLGKKDPFITVSSTDALSSVVEIFGSGVHRVAVVQEGTQHVIGMLSQLRLIRYFWDNARSFPSIEALYPSTLRQLKLGSTAVISIHGEKMVIDALELMNSEGVSSLAVVDSQHNVVGNIATAHVKYLTRSSSIPLLKASCYHFMSVILTDKGMEDGKDSYPVFHVSPSSSLAHTIAKLVATQAHRMWIVESASPSSSAPPTPTHTISAPPPPGVPISPSLQTAAMTMAPFPAWNSGMLTGVVSLSDILNLFARSAGLAPVDPDEARRQRRRSSSSSMRTSFDSSNRNSLDLRELRERSSRGSFEIRR